MKSEDRMNTYREMYQDVANLQSSLIAFDTWQGLPPVEFTAIRAAYNAFTEAKTRLSDCVRSARIELEKEESNPEKVTK